MNNNTSDIKNVEINHHFEMSIENSDENVLDNYEYYKNLLKNDRD